ncbi:Eco57I restriction-modification methylase domain-containing protein [Nannocystis pusilla]|uniref:Eco57I restriction-modification methylase domain-containing protein n=1 Tax=Nannocystis pusilla TaxID=889268 RepID=UPI003B7989B3
MGCGAFLLAVARRLALHLVAAWERAGHLPPDRHRLARRLVVERCVFGVDADPFAVALARRSLWLLFGTGDPPTGFLFKNLRHGDALLGLDLACLRAFHWRPAPAQPAIAAATARDPELAARLGDLVVGAFLSQRTDRDRDSERRRRLLAVEAALARGNDLPALPVPAPLAPPLHWQLAFSHPFDAFVGNPPFLGGSQISGAFGDPYLAWLLALHPGAHGNADLCAHFLRRVDGFLAASGTIGFIATNTIGQGDTRTTGLQPLLARGHVLYDVTRDLPWPEAAVVTVAVVHLARGPRRPRPRPTCCASRRHTCPESHPQSATLPHSTCPIDQPPTNHPSPPTARASSPASPPTCTPAASGPTRVRSRRTAGSPSPAARSTARASCSPPWSGPSWSLATRATACGSSPTSGATTSPTPAARGASSSTSAPAAWPRPRPGPTSWRSCASASNRSATATPRGPPASLVALRRARARPLRRPPRPRSLRRQFTGRQAPRLRPLRHRLCL